MSDTAIQLDDDRIPPLVAPQAPHDDLSFDELSRVYSFDQVSDRRRMLVRLLLKEAAARQEPVRALDIGCGDGISEERPVNGLYLGAVRQAVSELWGVEPDESVKPSPLFDRFQYAVAESADLPESYFDLAYSYFVMEHVADVDAFFAAVYRCLKPGGTYLFVTPNGRHFFTRAASTLKRLKLDEAVLRVLRRDMVDEYHYPVQYLCNTESAIDRHAARAGFQPPEYAYCEQFGMTSYFRGPLRPMLSFLMWKRRTFHNRRALLNMFVRLTKPQGVNAAPVP